MDAALCCLLDGLLDLSKLDAGHSEGKRLRHQSRNTALQAFVGGETRFRS
jgi:hypothetical protein